MMHPKPERISSDLTLLFKFFIPVFYTVFFGAFTLAFWFTPVTQFTGYDQFSVRIFYTLIFVLGVLLIFFSIWRLKRIEITAEAIFITNYFKYYRYPLNDIEKIILKFPHSKIILKQKGSLGKTIHFIPSKFRLSTFINDYNPKITVEGL
jgi:hypothetical protein